MTSRFLALLLLATSLAAGQSVARDRDDCDEMSVTNVVDVADFQSPQPTELVVPCAMVDSGVLGPACQDVAFYVVNQHGTLLCRAELWVFAQNSSVPAVEASLAAVLEAPTQAGAVAVVPLLIPSVPVAVVLELPRLQAAGLGVHQRLQHQHGLAEHHGRLFLRRCLSILPTLVRGISGRTTMVLGTL